MLLAGDEDLARGRRVEAAEQVQQRALAGAGRAEDRDGLALAPPTSRRPSNTCVRSLPSRVGLAPGLRRSAMHGHPGVDSFIAQRLRRGRARRAPGGIQRGEKAMASATSAIMATSLACRSVGRPVM